VLGFVLVVTEDVRVVAVLLASVGIAFSQLAKLTITTEIRAINEAAFFRIKYDQPFFIHKDTY
jgi:hypothetical protein